MTEFFNEMLKLKGELDVEIQQLRAVNSHVLLTWMISAKDCRKRVVDVAQRMNNACAQRAAAKK